MLRYLPILSWDLKVDTLRGTKISAGVAISADFDRVGREKDTVISRGYINLRTAVLGDDDMRKTFKQDDPSAPR